MAAARKRATSTDANDAAFLAEIAAHPDDDAPRLVYADALIERGDPRGELIQLQCELARVDEDDERWFRMKHRERALLKAHADDWTKDLRKLGKHLAFELRRGFVEVIASTTQELAKIGDTLLLAAPLLDGVTAMAIERSFEPFIASRLFARMRTLRLGSFRRRIELSGLGALAGPIALRRFELDEVSLARSDLEEIVACRAFGQLRELEINRCLLGKAALAPLEGLESPLERFSLLSGKHPEDLVRALTRAPAFADLKALGLCNNPIGDSGLEAIVKTGRVKHLVELDLRSNELSSQTMIALVEEHLPAHGLRRLLLGGNAIDDALAIRIAEWPGAAELVKLDLGSAKLGNAGARALAQSPHLSKLRSLVLSNCKVNAATEKLLLASPHLARARLYVGERFLKRA